MATQIGKLDPSSPNNFKLSAEISYSLPSLPITKYQAQANDPVGRNGGMLQIKDNVGTGGSCFIYLPPDNGDPAITASSNNPGYGGDPRATT